MCGIVGFIGKPKDRDACFELTTALLAKTQVRGDDASGFWATNTANGDNGVAYFSKAAKKSTEFIKTPSWQNLKGKDLNLLISHCRRSSNKGSENRNRNNHPFLSSTYRTALVHNGNVPEFNVLKKKYEIDTECDSEILLRIMEKGPQYPIPFLRQLLGKVKTTDGTLIDDLEDKDIPMWSHKVLGLADIFARINYGAMAVGIAERWDDDTRALWMFRNKERPLQVIDMRESLGQIYLVSEKRIFREAVEATPSIRKYVKGNTPILEFPPMCVWVLMLTTKGEIEVKKMTIDRRRKYNTTFEQERPTLEDAPKSKPLKIVTNLDCTTFEVKTTSKPNHQPAKQHKNHQPANQQKPGPANQVPVKTNGSAANPTKLPIISGPAGPNAADHITDWPDDCYEYIHRFITYTSASSGNVHPTSPGPIKDLETTALESKITDPAWTTKSKGQVIAAKITGSEDFITWAQLLQTKCGWMPRYRGDKAVTLSSLLSEGHDRWAKHVEGPVEEPPIPNVKTITDFPQNAFEFVHKCMMTMSKPSGIWASAKRVEYGPASDIKQSAFTAQIPDPSVTTVNLSVEDYEAWAKVLQNEYGWCERSVQGVHIPMGQLLKDYHETWHAFIETIPSDNILVEIDKEPIIQLVDDLEDDLDVDVSTLGDDDLEDDLGTNEDRNVVAIEDLTKVVNSHIDHLTPPFIVDDDNDQPLRTYDMAIERKAIDQTDLERFNETLSSVRSNLDDLDVMVAELFREGTLQKSNFDDILQNLSDVVGLLSSDKFMVENIRRQAT